MCFGPTNQVQDLFGTKHALSLSCDNGTIGDLKQKLHELMDCRLGEKEHRLARAKEQKDATGLWKMVLAAIETVFIDFFLSSFTLE